MKKLVCNYSVIRFLPYPETEEFVNVGIIASCPQIGWMDFRIDLRKTKRIHDFFPEMGVELYKNGRKRLIEELSRLIVDFRETDLRQWVMPERRDFIAGLFSEIIRPREELFRFSEPATLLTKKPKQDLEKVYNHYIERHFAQHREYQETIMKDRISELFHERNLQARYRDLRVGTDDYHVQLPFVEIQEGAMRPTRALKPLNLAQKDVPQIFNHGDAWRSKMNRLSTVGCLPQSMMFAVQLPPKQDKKRYSAAQEICNEFNDLNYKTADYSNERDVLDFAE